jgi:hypothetical protein
VSGAFLISRLQACLKDREIKKEPTKVVGKGLTSLQGHPLGPFRGQSREMNPVLFIWKSSLIESTDVVGARATSLQGHPLGHFRIRRSFNGGGVEAIPKERKSQIPNSNVQKASKGLHHCRATLWAATASAVVLTEVEWKQSRRKGNPKSQIPMSKRQAKGYIIAGPPFGPLPHTP